MSILENVYGTVVIKRLYSALKVNYVMNGVGKRAEWGEISKFEKMWEQMN